MHTLEDRKGRTLTGVVVSDKNDKTIVVRVETLVKHPLLKKYVRRRMKFTAHDPMNECGMGDKVKIVEYRPLSRNKRWHLVSVIEKGRVGLRHDSRLNPRFRSPIIPAPKRLPALRCWAVHTVAMPLWAISSWFPSRKPCPTAR